MVRVRYDVTSSLSGGVSGSPSGESSPPSPEGGLKKSVDAQVRARNPTTQGTKP